MTQSNLNLNFGKQLIFASIAGSSLVAAFNYEVNLILMPSMTAKYSEFNMNYPWENQLKTNNLSVDDYQEYDTMITFAKKVVSESKDIDLDIQLAVNKIFWDLL